MKTPIFLLCVYRKHAGPINSGMMYLPRGHRHRHTPYKDMLRNPEAVMQKFKGDQDFLDGYFRSDCVFWQEIFPGEIKSYKGELRGRSPDKENIIYFHGQPRPWAVKAEWIPPLF